ncbi:MAG TPA: TlpA disulfide reductase family protein [Pyrinomonadaceae bacterium]|nr:TlpA disulfide reductase family protein [Pyrinomonadaceae bacterium]
MSRHEHEPSNRRPRSRANVVRFALAATAAIVFAAPACYQVRDDGTEIASTTTTPTPAAATARNPQAPPPGAPAAPRGMNAPPLGQTQQGALKSDVLPEAVMTAQLSTVDGKKFRLADYKGKKIVVLDIWATWCGPCRNMIPHLVELQNEMGPKGVEVVGLTTEDPATDAEKVRAFARDFKINYRVGWADDTFILALLGPRYSIPQTFLLGRDGRLYYHVAGYSPQVPLTLNQIIARLEAGEGGGGE